MRWRRWFSSNLAFAGAYPCCCDSGGGSSTSGRGHCFCCGPGFYDYQDPPGGPLEWRLSIGDIGGSCLGQSCVPASGIHFAAYAAGCTWIGPRFMLCSADDCFAWVLSIGHYPSCDANPVDHDAMRLVLADLCSGGELLRYENPCGTRIGFPAPYCDPPVTLTCNGPNVLAFHSGVGLCTGPPTVTVEPVY